MRNRLHLTRHHLSRLHLASWIDWLVVLILVLPVLLPLVRPAFFVSDDGRFHVYRIAALAQAWQDGVWYPRLFPEFGFGYGQAVLNFYSPLSYWPGALLAFLGVAPATAVQWSIALSFVLAALTNFLYLRSLWGRSAGWVGATVYTYFFYHITDAYIRGALPEHTAFIFPPLILWAYTHLYRAPNPWPAFAWGSLAWAGLVLTHNLTALLMVPVFLLHMGISLLWTKQWQRFWLAISSLILAVLISAGYWLPVILESDAVGIAGGPSQGYRQHLLTLINLVARPLVYPYTRLPEQPIVYPLDWLSIVFFFVAAGGLLWKWRQRRLPVAWPQLSFFLILSLSTVFMLTTSSLPVWKLVEPVLAYLQYPWRFLTLTALGISGLAASIPMLFPRLRWKPWLAGIFLLAFCVSLPNLPFEPLTLPAQESWSPQRMWREDAETGQIGATWTGEFLPVTVREQRWAIGRPRQEALDTAPMPAPTVRLQEIGYQQTMVEVENTVPWSLRLHQFAQPGWHAALDGAEIPISASGDLGLVSVDIPAGVHHVRLWFGTTPARTAGSLLAALGVLLWVGIIWRKRQQMSAREQIGAVVLLGLMLLLLLNSYGIGQQTRTPVSHQVKLGDFALLVGHEAKAVPHANALDVTLYWLALRETATNYRAFVHVVDGSGAVFAQNDSDPVGGFTPTTRWQPGELVADRHRVFLPEGTPAQDFSLKAGLYQPEPLVNLTVEPPTADNRADLGTVQWP